MRPCPDMQLRLEPLLAELLFTFKDLPNDRRDLFVPWEDDSSGAEAEQPWLGLEGAMPYLFLGMIAFQRLFILGSLLVPLQIIKSRHLGISVKAFALHSHRAQVKHRRSGCSVQIVVSSRLRINAAYSHGTLRISALSWCAADVDYCLVCVPD